MKIRTTKVVVMPKVKLGGNNAYHRLTQTGLLHSNNENYKVLEQQLEIKMIPNLECQGQRVWW